MATKPVSFAWSGEHLPDLAALRGYMERLGSVAWIRGVAIHHTWRPTVAQWRSAGGARYMASLERTYRQKRPAWNGGPALFIGTDGYWIGTPWTVAGVHAGECNKSHLGIEVVGDYDHREWEEPIRSLAFDAAAAVLLWKNLPVHEGTVKGHRECLPNKSCPGNAISMDMIRSRLRESVAQMRDAHAIRYTISAAGTNVRSVPRVERGTVLGKLARHTIIEGYPVVGTAPIGEKESTWIRFVYERQTAYVWNGLVEPITPKETA